MGEKDLTQRIGLDDLPEDCRQIAEIIGLPALLALSRSMGGERVYIPQPERLSVCARNRAIREQFNGRNHQELANQYGITVRWVRVILANGDPEENAVCQPRQTQLKLF